MKYFTEIWFNQNPDAFLLEWQYILRPQSLLKYIYIFELDRNTHRAIFKKPRVIVMAKQSFLYEPLNP